MAHLVRFLKHKIDGDIFAMFPQFNFNTGLYGNKQKMCYVHIGQHSSCAFDIHKQASDNPYIPAKPEEYADLLNELHQIGYTDIRIVR